jgi:hypothetical protein
MLYTINRIINQTLKQRVSQHICDAEISVLLLVNPCGICRNVVYHEKYNIRVINVLPCVVGFGQWNLGFTTELSRGIVLAV